MTRTLENWEIARERCIESLEEYRTAKNLWRRAVKECAESIALAELANENHDYKSAEAYLACVDKALELARKCREMKKSSAENAIVYYQQMKEKLN